VTTNFTARSHDPRGCLGQLIECGHERGLVAGVGGHAKSMKTIRSLRDSPREVGDGRASTIGRYSGIVR
jgi:hypothetical protein